MLIARPSSMRFAAFATLLLSTLGACANDGRNRYEQGLAAELVHLQEPVAPAAGFRVVAEDMAGGADGDPAFRWLTRPALALLRLSAYRTHLTFGPAPYPMAVFDLSAENADTPLKIEAGIPRGRHPGGSHDGGVNLDLGYYLNSEKGKFETPDYAACTEHHKDGAVEANICRGPADRLDTARQTYFLLELLRQHRERFGSELIEQIGIDAQVRIAVLKLAHQWSKEGRHGATAAGIAELETLFASSPYEGWATSHHHHIHLRLRPIEHSGRHRAAFTALIHQDRVLDGRLLADGAASARGCALVSELGSYALTRTLDLRLVGPGCQLKSQRLRFNGGAWSAPLDPLEPLHHVVDVPAGPQFMAQQAEAELEFLDGSKAVLKRDIALPAQAAWLRVRVEARDFVARTQVQGAALEVRLDFPPAHAVLIDHLDLLVRRKGQAELLRVKLAPGQPQAQLADADQIESIEAEVGLSRRVRLRVPVPR